MSLSWLERKLIGKQSSMEERRKYVAFIHERNILSLNTPTAFLK